MMTIYLRCFKVVAASALLLAVAIRQVGGQTSGGVEGIALDWPSSGDLLVLYEVALNTELPGTYAASGFISLSKAKRQLELPDHSEEIPTYKSVAFTSAFDCNQMVVVGTFIVSFYSEQVQFKSEPVHVIVGPGKFPHVHHYKLVERVCERAFLIG